MTIVGVDPGIERLGWGVVRSEGSRLMCLGYGCITTPHLPTPERLTMIADAFEGLLAEHEPDALATERQLFAANKTTAMEVAKALGVILLLGSRRGLDWAEYPPPEVKKAVTGQGAAGKEQVTFMVRRLLGMTEDPTPNHASDALAIAITHALRRPLAGGDR